MFDIGWMELLVIGVVALIVIGPKDLPEMFRQLGRFTGKLRGMAREFQRAMDQAAKDSGVGDVAKDLKSMTSPRNLGLDAVKSAADRFEKWDPMKNAAKPSNPAMVGAKPLEVKLPPNPVPAAAAPVVETVADVVAAPAAPAPMPFAAAAKAAPGSATAALAEKQAAKRAVLAETAERLRAIEAGSAAPEKPKRTRKPAAAAEAAAPPKPPRAPRKSKAPDA